MTNDELLESISALLHFGEKWHARARGSKTYSTGATAREAMLAALGLTDSVVDEQPNADLF